MIHYLDMRQLNSCTLCSCIWSLSLGSTQLWRPHYLARERFGKNSIEDIFVLMNNWLFPLPDQFFAPFQCSPLFPAENENSVYLSGTCSMHHTGWQAITAHSPEGLFVWLFLISPFMLVNKRNCSLYSQNGSFCNYLYVVLECNFMGWGEAAFTN